MKTLKYLFVGILLLNLLPVCISQTPVKGKQVITLQSVRKNAPRELLAESKAVLTRRLERMDLRDVQISLNNSTAELIITVVDTISPATLSEILLTRGNVGFKADTLLALNQENLSDVHADFTRPDHPALCISFKEDKWKALEDLTAGNMGKPVAFVVDDNVYSAPVITDKISHGQISLTGSGFSTAEVRKLVAILSSGPVPLKFILANQK
ncbi:MAG TPA: hypothetical protein PKG48_01005 [Bacteroidales bacterium]|nr:hypothetical protein [Bacteroidales bacterium]